MSNPLTSVIDTVKNVEFTFCLYAFEDCCANNLVTGEGSGRRKPGRTFSAIFLASFYNFLDTFNMIASDYLV